MRLIWKSRPLVADDIVIAHHARRFVAEDIVERCRGDEGNMSVLRPQWLFGELLVDLRKVGLYQMAIGFLNCRDTGKPQSLGQAILIDAMIALHSSFRLW